MHKVGEEALDVRAILILIRHDHEAAVPQLLCRRVLVPKLEALLRMSGLVK